MKPIKGFLPPHVKASREKKESSSSHSLSLSFTFSSLFFDFFFLIIYQSKDIFYLYYFDLHYICPCFTTITTSPFPLSFLHYSFAYLELQK